jgi:hypothetical protein
MMGMNMTAKDARRHLAFGFGLFATLSWIILLRYCTRLFWTSPIIPWSLVAGTLALTSMRQKMLADATSAAPARDATLTEASFASSCASPIPDSDDAVASAQQPVSRPA